jgi:hypothetical protein
MKLGRANELAAMKGKPALIERGSIIETGRHRWKVLYVRGSTVTAEPWPYWHQRVAARAARAAAWIRRGGRPRKPGAPRPVVTVPAINEGTPMSQKPVMSWQPIAIAFGTTVFIFALIFAAWYFRRHPL